MNINTRLHAFLNDFFAYDNKDFESFVRIARPLVTYWVRRHGFRLALDQYEDVFQEVCIQTLDVPSDEFDPDRATGLQILYGTTRNCIRKVERQYGLRLGESYVDFVDPDPLSDVPAPVDFAEELDTSILVHEVLAKATPNLRTCLIEISRGMSADGAAKQVGWSRFRLHREKKALRSLFVLQTRLDTIEGLSGYTPPVSQLEH